MPDLNESVEVTKCVRLTSDNHLCHTLSFNDKMEKGHWRSQHFGLGATQPAVHRWCILLKLSRAARGL